MNAESWYQFDSDAFYYEDATKNIKYELHASGLRTEMIFSFFKCNDEYEESDPFVFALYLNETNIINYKSCRKVQTEEKDESVLICNFQLEDSDNFMHILNTVNAEMNFFEQNVRIISFSDAASHTVYSRYLPLFECERRRCDSEDIPTHTLYPSTSRTRIELSEEIQLELQRMNEDEFWFDPDTGGFMVDQYSAVLECILSNELVKNVTPSTVDNLIVRQPLLSHFDEITQEERFKIILEQQHNICDKLCELVCELSSDVWSSHYEKDGIVHLKNHYGGNTREYFNMCLTDLLSLYKLFLFCKKHGLYIHITKN